MVGVGVGLDQPFDLEARFLNKTNDLISRFMTDAPSRVVEVHHGIYDSAGAGPRILHDITYCMGLLVEEGGDLGSNAQVNGMRHGRH